MINEEDLEIVDSEATSKIFLGIGESVLDAYTFDTDPINFWEYMKRIASLERKRKNNKLTKQDVIDFYKPIRRKDRSAKAVKQGIDRYKEDYGSLDDAEGLSKKFNLEKSVVHRHIKKLLKIGVIKPKKSTLEDYEYIAKELGCDLKDIFYKDGINPVKSVGRTPPRRYEVDSQGIIHLMFELVGYGLFTGYNKILSPRSFVDLDIPDYAKDRGIVDFRDVRRIINKNRNQIFTLQPKHLGLMHLSAEIKKYDYMSPYINEVKLKPEQIPRYKPINALTLLIESYFYHFSTHMVNMHFMHRKDFAGRFNIREILVLFMVELKELFVDLTLSDYGSEISESDGLNPLTHETILTKDGNMIIQNILKDIPLSTMLQLIDREIVGSERLILRDLVLNVSSDASYNTLETALETAFDLEYTRKIYTKTYFESKEEKYQRIIKETQEEDKKGNFKNFNKETLKSIGGYRERINEQYETAFKAFEDPIKEEIKEIEKELIESIEAHIKKSKKTKSKKIEPFKIHTWEPHSQFYQGLKKKYGDYLEIVNLDTTDNFREYLKRLKGESSDTKAQEIFEKFTKELIKK